MIQRLINFFKKKDCLECSTPNFEEFYRQLEDDRLPYIETNINGDLIRTFLSRAPEHLYKWHTDEEDRLITILHDTDFKFQFDNEIPQRLYKGKQIKIPEGIFHRLIKGNVSTAIKIEKLPKSKS